MGSMMGMINVFAVVIYMILIYLLSKIIIEKKGPVYFHDQDSRLYKWRDQ